MSVITRQSERSLATQEIIEVAVAAAHKSSQPVLLTHLEPFPAQVNALAFLQASAEALGNGVFWSQAETGTTFAGAGVSEVMSANGADRFVSVSAALQHIRETVVGHTQHETFPIIGGFAFDDYNGEPDTWIGFPSARFRIPTLLLQQQDGATSLRVTLSIDEFDIADDIADRFSALIEQSRHWAQTPRAEYPPAGHIVQRSEPVRASWESSVAFAISRIREGFLDKVVLARALQLFASDCFTPFQALHNLGEVDPAATLFGMQSGNAWFLGASPERLVRLNNGRVDVTCLAGSVGIGNTPSEKHDLANQLLTSEKNREEHEIVVRSTISALQEVCESVIRVPNTPRVITARSVQHLETPLVGHLSSEGNVIDLVARLHPTPAVGGFPHIPALDAIRELEEIDRGWYAGPFGWTDLDGSGEFVVALRSGLISGRSATLFAGCGIVADSIPADEYEETRLKLRPMLNALGAGDPI